MPHPRDRLLATERETAKLMIQNPELFPPEWDGLSVADFTHPAYAAVFAAVERAGAEGLPANGATAADWVHRISEASPSEEVRSLVAALAVEPPLIRGAVTSRFVVANTAKLQLLTVMRADRRAQVAAAAHQPGGVAQEVQPDVLRARGAGGQRQGAAHPQHRRRRLAVVRSRPTRYLPPPLRCLRPPSLPLSTFAAHVAVAKVTKGSEVRRRVARDAPRLSTDCPQTPVAVTLRRPHSGGHDRSRGRGDLADPR